MRGTPSEHAFLDLGNEFKFIQDYHDVYEIEKQVEEIKIYDVTRVNKLYLRGSSEEEAIKTHLSALKWKPNELNIQDVNTVYKSKLQRSCIAKYPVTKRPDVTMEFKGVTHTEMHSTTSAILDGLVKDVTDTNAQNETSMMNS